MIEEDGNILGSITSRDPNLDITVKVGETKYAGVNTTGQPQSNPFNENICILTHPIFA